MRLKCKFHKVKRLGFFIGNNKGFSGNLQEKLLIRAMFGFWFTTLVVEIYGGEWINEIKRIFKIITK